ncbi:diaminopimelate epimerase [Candidatus Poriferisodalis sp.]|uniref:diaminopimelate epimerase n=1 Tax=Candidatus Poriferisodalis sp. TaxID=3101277 RepID=UPI003B0243CB
MDTLRLAKHHALRNDFLILLLSADEKSTLDASLLDWSGLAKKACDRRSGIGADGLILGMIQSSPRAQWEESTFENSRYVDGTARIRMVLYNSDGSDAEVSGNGVACLADALAHSQEPWRTAYDELREAYLRVEVETDAGDRTVAWRNSVFDTPHEGRVVLDTNVDVNMPLVMPGPEISPALDALISERFGGAARGTGDVGNPHLVINAGGQIDEIETAQLGALYESYFPRGINVEFIWSRGDERPSIGMSVWERGAGITQACGTGAVAAAVRAGDWGVVPRDFGTYVHMPGGDFALVVQLGPTNKPQLQVHAERIADIDWPLRGPWLDA